MPLLGFYIFNYKDGLMWAYLASNQPRDLLGILVSAGPSLGSWRGAFRAFWIYQYFDWGLDRDCAPWLPNTF
jgi:hypothetical protein